VRLSRRRGQWWVCLSCHCLQAIEMWQWWLDVVGRGSQESFCPQVMLRQTSSEEFLK
jgi:hypothetical protein